MRLFQFLFYFSDFIFIIIKFSDGPLINQCEMLIIGKNTQKAIHHTLNVHRKKAKFQRWLIFHTKKWFPLSYLFTC